MSNTEEELCDCGYELNSFACKIRHINVSVSNLKRERENNSPNFGLEEQR